MRGSFLNFFYLADAKTQSSLRFMANPLRLVGKSEVKYSFIKGRAKLNEGK